MLPRCRSKNSTTDRLRSELDAAYFRTPFLCYFLVSDDEQTSTEELLTAGKSKTGAGTPTGNLRKRLDGPNSINQHGYPTELMSAPAARPEIGFQTVKKHYEPTQLLRQEETPQGQVSGQKIVQGQEEQRRIRPHQCGRCQTAIEN